MRVIWPLVVVGEGGLIPKGYGFCYQHELAGVFAPVPLNLVIGACLWVWDGLRRRWVPRGTIGRLMAESYIRGHRKGRMAGAEDWKGVGYQKGFEEGYDIGTANEAERITRNLNRLLDETARESSARYCDSLTKTEPEPKDPCVAEVEKAFDEYLPGTIPGDKKPPA